MSFRREKFIPKGGPNGGDGGRGGDIYFRADPRLKTLLDFIRKPQFQAERGLAGSSYLKSGKSGEDLILEVPCGTVITKGRTLVADLVDPGTPILVAKGGRGGRGNVHFKSSVRQAPRIAERGEPGESAELELQLKMIADVGLIGLPNAGKSTLLSRLTRAHPKIANYPFTTLHPNLGVAYHHDREIVFADIPGLIEGSHTGRGLGHDFLRHIERTRVLVHVVDPLGYDGRPPKENIKIIDKELRKYSQALARKPQLIVVNKQDLTGAAEVAKEVRTSFKSRKVLAVSGVSGEGIDKLLKEAAELLALTKAEVASPPPEVPVHVHLEPEFWVEREGDGFVVKGKKVERLVAMTNFNLPEAVERTQYILKKFGVEKELMRHGARAGDPVQIFGYEFSFQPDVSLEGGARKR